MVLGECTEPKQSIYFRVGFLLNISRVSSLFTSPKVPNNDQDSIDDSCFLTQCRRFCSHWLTCLFPPETATKLRPIHTLFLTLEPRSLCPPRARKLAPISSREQPQHRTSARCISLKSCPRYSRVKCHAARRLCTQVTVFLPHFLHFKSPQIMRGVRRGTYSPLWRWRVQLQLVSCSYCVVFVTLLWWFRCWEPSCAGSEGG